MKIKTLFALLLFMFLTATVSYSQNDTVITSAFNNKKVKIGNMYRIEYLNDRSVTCELLAINKHTILVLVDNEIEEFDIKGIKGIKDINDNTYIINDPKPPKISGKLYSLSAGYTQRYGETDNKYYYSRTKYKINGFNLMGDILLKNSDYFAFRFDFNFTQIFSSYLRPGYSNFSIYDTSINNTEIDLTGASIFAIKPALSFGFISDDYPFNIYANVGLGIGLVLKSDDIIYTYKTKGFKTTLTQTTVKKNSVIAIGTYGSVRISYKFSKKYSLFAEPSYQIWGNSIEQLISVNAGVTFLL